MTAIDIPSGPIREHHKGTMPFFVYGTLMHSDGGTPTWQDAVDRVERNLIVCGYSLYVTRHGFYPYAMKVASDEEYVFGELLWPRSDYHAGVLTSRFDQIEGHPDFYVRTMVEVTRTARQTQTAWMYTLPPDHMIPNQDYRAIGSSWKTWQRANPQARSTPCST
jgi:gamma-glutamylcyclotransferase (GGCT)/AIG2-like uncharacterized protein YtfP